MVLVTLRFRSVALLVAPVLCFLVVPGHHEVAVVAAVHGTRRVVRSQQASSSSSSSSPSLGGMEPFFLEAHDADRSHSPLSVFSRVASSLQATWQQATSWAVSVKSSSSLLLPDGSSVGLRKRLLQSWLLGSVLAFLLLLLLGSSVLHSVLRLHHHHHHQHQDRHEEHPLAVSHSLPAEPERTADQSKAPSSRGGPEVTSSSSSSGGGAAATAAAAGSDERHVDGDRSKASRPHAVRHGSRYAGNLSSSSVGADSSKEGKQSAAAGLRDKDLLRAGMENEALLLPGAITHALDAKPRNMPSLLPTFQEDQGTQFVWQIPPRARSAVFFAHGCNQHAAMFWDHHPNCTQCIGMPEDRALTLSALRRGIAVLAVKSRDQCWDATWPPSESHDGSRVASILREWREQNHLSKLPLYALGASSGGYFITMLAHLVQFKAMAVYISSGIPQALQTPPANGAYPPTLFVHMPRDSGTAERVLESIKVLRAKGVQSAQVECSPLPLSALFLAERIPPLNFTISEKMFGALQLKGFLDAKGFLLQDPRMSNWQDVFARYGLLSGWVDMPEAVVVKWIAEELNLAFGFHELTSMKAAETFDWFSDKCWRRGRYRHHRCHNSLSISTDSM